MHLRQAGRTDRGVSAVSQVFNVVPRDLPKGAGPTGATATSDDLSSAAVILEKLRQSKAVQAGRIAIIDCKRVPKKFNARSRATWRRYCYLFPCTNASPDAVDVASGFSAAGEGAAEHASTGGVDLAFLNDVLGRVEGRYMRFNALAHGSNRAEGSGMQDRITLFQAKAYPVWLPTGHRTPHDPDPAGDCDAARRVLGEADVVNPGSDELGPPDAICVDLVGSRFLQRMVRILGATAIREAMLPPTGPRNPAVLVDACRGGDRAAAARPLPSAGLAFCGVGFDTDDLAVYKDAPSNPDKIKALDDAVRARLADGGFDV